MRNNKGITLIELIVVVSIMAILAGIAVPNLSNTFSKSRKRSDDDLLTTIENANVAYYHMFGSQSFNEHEDQTSETFNASLELLEPFMMPMDELQYYDKLYWQKNADGDWKIAREFKGIVMAAPLPTATPAVTAAPTTVPTSTPTTEPTPDPTAASTPTPTSEPTPTAEPTATPTLAPTPTVEPTATIAPEQWNKKTKYKIGDVVTYDNKQYQARKNNKNKRPDKKPNHWELIDS